MKVMIIFLCLVCLHKVFGHDLFSSGDCLEAHNNLRKLHSNTNNVGYSKELEAEAQMYVDQLQQSDTTIDVRPTRILPKRRKRHVHDVDPNKHLESWDGEIFFPSASWRRNDNRVMKIGENIHKFCCYTYPHCPRQFLHNLVFPPTASGVVKDWYNEEINHYDFANGVKTSSYSQINHFTNIVWRKTTKIGCAQSQMTADKCVYTIVLYEEEGSFGDPENFRKNVGGLESVESDSGSRILVIFLVIFFIVLIVAAFVLCYCCRDKMHDKYVDVKIKVDTMKAEQELETDSTSFWWLRICRRRQVQKRRTTVSRPKHMSLKERPTIEVIPNSAPQRTRPPPPRVRGQSNAAMISRYQGISKKPESLPVRDNHGYEPMNLPVANKPVANKPAFGRTPSLSGKAPPPPVPVGKMPSNPLMLSRPPAPSHQLPPRPPVAKTLSNNEERQRLARTPQPVSKTPSNPINKLPNVPLKPLVPGKPSPKPAARPSPAPRKGVAPANSFNSNSVNQSKPLFPPVKPKNTIADVYENDDHPNRTVAEMKKLLENK
ncbi:uncharacterized protein LOC130655843 [Hydractinia symbiolongicarpus]|uniref:uncharacterized protein LOC130655843 n=1 Tax=Hydractinia symbiolongicarpus TaxID=13093 RepID=UPI002549EBF3|nr:uncharacterized protein LOC130655843 [Hydractinia symbiolongicarpus]